MTQRRPHVILAIQEARRAEFVTYHSCRLCHKRADETPERALWKYAVRAYICATCRSKVLGTVTTEA